MSDKLRDVLHVLLEMSNSELMELYRYLGDRVCMRPDVARGYVEVMNGIVGGDIRSRTRRREIAWGRFIVAHALMDQGWTTVSAARLFGMGHSAAIHARKCVENMLEYPGSYQKEYEIYREFKNKINDGNMYLAGKTGGKEVQVL